MQTPEREYALIFQGQVAAGSDMAEVKARFTTLMACAPEKTEELFSGRRLIFKRFASEEAAQKAADRFRHIGMMVEIQVVAAKPGRQPAPPPAATFTAPPTAQGAGAAPATPAAPVTPAAPIAPEGRRTRAQATAKERRVPFVFSGSGGEFFKIWIVNVLFGIVTLGIYSAWAKVRTLRYFYGNTSLDGSAFEYLADPIKILKGRLIVFAVFLANFVVSKFYPWIGPLFGLLILILMPWVIRQTLRFRLHYTAWRGVRFAFAGSLWDAAKAFVLWPLLTFGGYAVFMVVSVLAKAGNVPYSNVMMAPLALLALGLLFTLPIPWHRQTHYLADNSRYGGAGLQNHSTVGDFFKVFGWLALLSFLMLLAAIAIGFAVFYNLKHSGLSWRQTSIVASFLPTTLVLVFWLFLLPLYKVKMTNLRIGKTVLGPHRLVSTYAFWSYLGLVITNTLAVIATLGLFYPFAKVRTARYAAEHTAMIIDGDLDGFVADRQAEVSAVGSETGDFLDIDIGF